MRVVASRSIRAPLAVVFETFADIEHCAGRIKGVTKAEIVSEVHSGKGLRWLETRLMFGKDATAEKEITAFDAPRSFRVESRIDGTNYVSTYSFAPGEDAGLTVATWTHDSVALTFGAKLMSPVLFLFQGMMRKLMQKDLTDLAEFLERSA